MNNTTQQQHISELLDQLYKDVNAKEVSIAARDRLGIKEEAFVYGEITFEDFPKILEIVKPKAGETFCDLGCGSGKAVFAAAAYYDFAKVTGVELLEPLYQLCLTQKEKFQHSAAIKRAFSDKKMNIDFQLGDLFFFDIRNVDIVYVNATCFVGDTWTRLQNKLKGVKKGTRIILSTKHIYDPCLQHIHTSLFKFSWADCTINIYEKITD